MIAIPNGIFSAGTVAGEMRRLPWSARNRDTYVASAVRTNCIYRLSVYVYIWYRGLCVGICNDCVIISIQGIY